MLWVPPVDPERMGRNGQLLREGAEALGVSARAASPQRRRLPPVQLLPVRLPPRRQAGHARFLSAARRRRWRPGASGRRRTQRSSSNAIAPSASSCMARPTAGRAPRSASAPGGQWCVAGGAFGTPELLLRSGLRSPSGAARPQPANPPGLLGRSPLRRGGPRLGRRHAELRRRPSGSRAGSCSKRPSRRSRSAPSGFPARARDHQRRVLDYDHDRLHRSPPLRSLVGPGRARPATARSASATSSPTTTPRLVFGIARAAELLYAAGAREVYPQISGIRMLRASRSPTWRPPLRPRRAPPRGLSPDGHRAHGRKPGRRSSRRTARSTARPGSTSPTAACCQLHRGQPDDDHHRDGLTRGPPNGGPAELTDPGNDDGRPKTAVASTSPPPGRVAPEVTSTDRSRAGGRRLAAEAVAGSEEEEEEEGLRPGLLRRHRGRRGSGQPHPRTTSPLPASLRTLRPSRRSREQPETDADLPLVVDARPQQFTPSRAG